MNAARRNSSSLTEVSKAPSNLVFFCIPLSSSLVFSLRFLLIEPVSSWLRLLFTAGIVT
jgi:hypothetical protein